MEVIALKDPVQYKLTHNGKTVGIDGQTTFSALDGLAEALKPRGLVILPDMQVVKQAVEQLPSLEEALALAEEAAAPEVESAANVVITAKQQKALDGLLKQAKKTEAAAPKKSGRPRLYTPEEALERRRAQNREAAAKARAANPKKMAERAKKFREDNPEKVEQYRKNSYSSRRARLDNDPEYRAQYNEYQREYRKARREAQKKAAE